MTLIARIDVPSGPVIVKKGLWVPPELERAVQWKPKTNLGTSVKTVLDFALVHGLPWEQACELIDRITSCLVVETSLEIVALIWNEKLGIRQAINYGVVSHKVVTDAGVDKLEDSFRNSFEPETWNYHGIGTGTNAEAVGDTALQTELTTEYNPNSTRATGTQSAAAANIYQSVGVNTLDSGTPAVTEHGLLSQAATGGGTLWDRSVFSAINLTGANGDGLQTTYKATFTSGG